MKVSKEILVFVLVKLVSHALYAIVKCLVTCNVQCIFIHYVWMCRCDL